MGRKILNWEYDTQEKVYRSPNGRFVATRHKGWWEIWHLREPPNTARSHKVSGWNPSLRLAIELFEEDLNCGRRDAQTGEETGKKEDPDFLCGGNVMTKQDVLDTLSRAGKRIRGGRK